MAGGWIVKQLPQSAVVVMETWSALQAMPATVQDSTSSGKEKDAAAMASFDSRVVPSWSDRDAANPASEQIVTEGSSQSTGPAPVVRSVAGTSAGPARKTAPIPIAANTVAAMDSNTQTKRRSEPVKARNLRVARASAIATARELLHLRPATARGFVPSGPHRARAGCATSGQCLEQPGQGCGTHRSLWGPWALVVTKNSWHGFHLRERARESTSCSQTPWTKVETRLRGAGSGVPGRMSARGAPKRTAAVPQKETALTGELCWQSFRKLSAPPPQAGHDVIRATNGMRIGATRLLFVALVGLALVVGSVAEAEAAGFTQAETASTCASGELFKRDFAGLGCYPDSADPRYYEAVHQLEAERAAFRTWLYGGIAAGVAALAVGGLAYALLRGCSSPKASSKVA